MLLDLIFGGFQKEDIIVLLMWIPIVMLSLSLHETAHAYIAYKLGDPTARNLGRCTMNPIKHIDPMGFLAMLVVGFGWANPVPINSRNFENPKKGMAISSLAGPVSNLLLATLMALLFAIFEGLYMFSPFFAKNETTMIALYYVALFFYYGVWLNVSLAIFNFIPVPPLDGSRILGLILPTKYYFKFMEYERYIGIGFAIVVIALSYMGISIISWIVEPVASGIMWLFETPIIALLEKIWLS